MRYQGGQFFGCRGETARGNELGPVLFIFVASFLQSWPVEILIYCLHLTISRLVDAKPVQEVPSRVKDRLAPNCQAPPGAGGAIEAKEIATRQ